MFEYKKYERFIIHSYKHPGNIHRAWDEAVLLDECEDYLVFGNDKTKVLESDGRSWRTKEPSILFFYKKKWYNVIGQLKNEERLNLSHCCYFTMEYCLTLPLPLTLISVWVILPSATRARQSAEAFCVLTSTAVASSDATWGAVARASRIACLIGSLAICALDGVLRRFSFFSSIFARASVAKVLISSDAADAATAL